MRTENKAHLMSILEDLVTKGKKPEFCDAFIVDGAAFPGVPMSAILFITILALAIEHIDPFSPAF